MFVFCIYILQNTDDYLQLNRDFCYYDVECLVVCIIFALEKLQK